MAAQAAQGRLQRVSSHIVGSTGSDTFASLAAETGGGGGGSSSSRSRIPAIWGHSPGEIESRRDQEEHATVIATTEPPTPFEEFQFDLNGYVVLRGALGAKEVARINAALDKLPRMKLGDWLGHAHVTAGPGDVSLQQIYELGPEFERLIDVSVCPLPIPPFSPSPLRTVVFKGGSAWRAADLWVMCSTRAASSLLWQAAAFYRWQSVGQPAQWSAHDRRGIC
jgi:hypothetical protein